MALALWSLKVCLQTRTRKNLLSSSTKVSFPLTPHELTKPCFSQNIRLALSYLQFRMYYVVSADSWLHGVFLKFSTVTHVFLLFSFWWLSGFQILTNQEKIKPSQNLSFITVCSGWNVKFSRTHGLRVNYDPNWKMSWVHLSHSYPHWGSVLFHSPHWVLSFALLPHFHLGSLLTLQVDL